MFLLSLLLLLFLLLFWKIWNMRRIVECSRKIKCGLKSYPLIGHAYLFMGNGVDHMDAFKTLSQDSYEHYGMSGIWLGPKFYVHVVDPVNAEVILKFALAKDNNTLRFARKLIGNGLIFAPVPIWRPRRKILAPTFNTKSLNSFQEVFSRQSAILVEEIERVVGQGVISIQKYLAAYSLDSICENAMNMKLNSQRHPELPFFKAFEKSCQLLVKRMLNPWLHFDVVYNLLPVYYELMKNRNIVIDFIAEAVQYCRKTMKENSGDDNGKKKSFVELMIDSSGGEHGYSNLELQEEALVLVSAGSDTTATSACFFISVMAMYPEIQEKIAEELQEVFGDSDRLLTANDLPRLKYLEIVIKETLRLYPSVPLMARQIEKDLLLPSGITLVAGCSVFINIWGTHRNPEYWGKDAEQFRPERFLEPLKHPTAFIPFSHGPRNCLGYQYAMNSLKTVLSSMLRRYRVLSAYTEHTPLTISFEIMAKDIDGCKVRLEHRKKCEST